MARPKLFPYLLILPAFLMIAVFVFYPTLYGIRLSLSQQIPITGEFRFIGLTNFRNLLLSSDFQHSITVSLRFVFFYVMLCTVLGLALAVLMNRKMAMTGLYMTLIFIPWVLSDVVAAIVWRWMFNQQVGIIEVTLRRLGVGPPLGILASSSGALFVMVFLSTWRGLPYVMLLLLGGLQSISSELLEAAKIDGASGWRAFFSITLPLLRGQLLVVLLLLSIGAMNASGSFLTLTDGGPGRSTEVMALYMYHLAFRFFQLAQGSAVAVIMFFFNLFITAIYIRVFREQFGIAS